MKTALIHSDQWTRFDYGPDHPLRMERLGLTWRLMEAYGLTSLADAKVYDPPPADETAIGRFHTREYLEILKEASERDRPGGRASTASAPGTTRSSPGCGRPPGWPPAARSWRRSSSPPAR